MHDYFIEPDREWIQPDYIIKMNDGHYNIVKTI